MSDETMTEVEKNQAEAALNELVLKKGAVTFVEMFGTANTAIGRVAGDQNAPGYRFADRYLQKSRKAGILVYRAPKGESGKKWLLTDAGRAALEARQA